MCQLMSMNGNTPTDIVFSFEGFHRRGGATDEHTDGFGIAFFEEKGVRIFLDDKPSAHSPVANLVRQYPIKSTNIIAHIRKATQGKVTLANTHPFIRELWGQYWVFAHNGNLENLPSFDPHYYRPVGDTDSEWAFCYLLEHLRHKYPQPPALEVVFDEIKLLTCTLNAHGAFNFILSNGEWMIAHCSTLLHYIVRQAPFGKAQLIDQEMSIDFSAATTKQDKVIVIATQPLTNNECWTAFEKGQIMLFQQGEVLRHCHCLVAD